ncbi:MAG: glycoside hydrolase family 5 protein [Fibrobacter sp.]|nr:glycoside hydrolase family 5 protein [Fibrobacter sp.]
MNKLSKLLIAGALAFTAIASADATTAKPHRVGPVQNYGTLGTSGGEIVSLKTGKTAMLRGVSLYWSDATGLQYYKSDVISWAAKNLGIDVFRFAMGIQYYNSDGNATEPMDESYSYMGASSTYLSKIDQMVQAAVENDVYIIIDWHSHRAENEITAADTFFTRMAKTYGNIPNVIFEIYNEPVRTAWSTITSYANQVASHIRQYSENLILVGTPSWSQLTDYGGVTATNVAYVFHFYAGTHTVGTYGSRITAAKNSGNAVFISEWGTTAANGKGDANTSNTNDWFTFMEANHLSNCNWSLRQETNPIDNTTEGSAIFSGSEFLTNAEDLNNATYTSSGSLVKQYLTQHKSSWADSLIAGNTAGSCHFTSTTVTETAGALTNLLKTGCTYTSSDETVASVDGTTLNILSAGYAILTANDNSQSIVVVEDEPEQTVSGLSDFTCRYGGTCTQSHSMANYSGASDYETILATTLTSTQGGALTFESLSKDIFEVKLATCTNTKSCYGALNSQVIMLQFTGTFGEGKLRVTAPAVTGYRALDDTLTITYAKGQQRIYSKFKDRTLTFGAVTEQNALPDTMMAEQIPVSYTYNGEASTPYLTKSGTTIIAGTENAIVMITASAPETDHYEAFEKSITVIVGDSTLAVNKDEYYRSPIVTRANVTPFQTQIQNNSVLLQVPQAGLVQWAVFSVTGKVVASHKEYMNAGSHLISLEKLPVGSYLFRVRQGSRVGTLHWNKH